MILLKFDTRIIIHLEIACSFLLIKVLKIESNWIIQLVGISTNHPSIEKLNNLTSGPLEPSILLDNQFP